MRYSLECSPLLVFVFSLAVVSCSCRAGVCQWKPFWIPVGDTIQKAYFEEWLRVGDDIISDFGENSINAILAANVSTMVRSSENKRLYRQAQTTFGRTFSTETNGAA